MQSNCKCISNVLAHGFVENLAGNLKASPLKSPLHCWNIAMWIRCTLANYRNHLLPLTCFTFGLLTCAGCNSDTTAAPAEAATTHQDDHAHAADTAATHQLATHSRNEAEQHSVQHPLYKVSSPRPESFDDAVATIVGLNESIKTAFSANQEAAADDRLHEVGRVLQTVNLLAEDADMTPAQRASVHGAVVRLFAAFSAVDATMHGEAGMSYEEASIDIEENLAALESIRTRPKE